MDLTKYSDFVFAYLSEYGLKIIAAVVILFIGKSAVKKLTALIKTVMIKAKIDLTLVEFLENVIYFALLIVVVLASLNALGINTTSFLAVFGAASLAIGLALKDSLSNIGAAVLIIIFRPFKVGDFIDAAGASGIVEDINLFSTVIATGDNKVTIVPNSSIISGNVTNYSNKTTRRVSHVFGIGYNDDLKLAKETLLQIMHDDERVLKEPAPFVAVGELGSSSVNLVFRAWVKTEDYWNVHFDMLERVKLTFDEKGISIPYPQMDVHVNKES
ncbi:MAG: mechanosensitive ion channel protein MscS [Sulfurimonas sp. RIFOXYD12_FULL_33_39]|uniref:mechanosensitive ion channel family protein n=1 Tax=unclassified Sulfurimonas TaxID=2623549 RepID=UPI0008C32427|nr:MULTISPECIES: mechanosensitive ion channel domain-containing protein [unclassified Sulfurimonas]OHE07036.1 MAG: mechanosensitive ion channel protein MscS [Sulfurimonas sp. RIFCSPLOWO2_12_FULL_34_6]OHE10851.1 MAG: mechanosensitive ion channel protein MscS [Sulfurimonas sp. RIFOXYD12_FULL_33_39]OHE13379.1 MAG: mechanosensitive ion channel protein MscS [Sulfurimonas sp. RIFOXYD2_FULL_34_21]